jgi:hypothetical protein
LQTSTSVLRQMPTNTSVTWTLTAPIMLGLTPVLVRLVSQATGKLAKVWNKAMYRHHLNGVSRILIENTYVCRYGLAYVSPTENRPKLRAARATEEIIITFHFTDTSPHMHSTCRVQSGPKVTSLVERCSRSRCTQRVRRMWRAGAYVAQMLRAIFAYDVRHSPRILQMLRAPAVRGMRSKGCYFWTPLYLWHQRNIPFRYKNEQGFASPINRGEMRTILTLDKPYQMAFIRKSASVFMRIKSAQKVMTSYGLPSLTGPGIFPSPTLL